MKKIITLLRYQPLNTDELRILTQEVKETLDVMPQTAVKPAFTAVDLWNIQRRYKTSFATRRFV
jgi:hypothetical protein